MNDKDLFNYDRFCSLTGADLINYAEPFVNTRHQAIPNSVYELLRSSLGWLDEAHLVYALEVCMLLKPMDFLAAVVAFLSHQDASVSCTAYRLISKLRAEAIPEYVKEKIAAIPIVDIFGPDLHSGNKTRIGTNQEFIRSLCTQFSHRPR